jgi:PLD-like domain
MSVPHEIYVKAGLVRRWKIEAGRVGGECSAFSPYLTSPTAETVLLAAETKARCRLYTLFDAEVFASGASSIGTVRRLQRAGLRLYAIPDLHAKIVIVPPHFASIGSQNLTRGGTKRREASVTITDRKLVEKIWSETQPWRDAASEITSDMINDMVQSLPKLRRGMKRFQREADALNERMRANERERAAQRNEQERLKAEAERRRRIEELREATTRSWQQDVSRSRDVIRADVAREEDAAGRLRFILRPTQPSCDLTEWRMADWSKTRFDRLYCYLGFIRLMRTWLHGGRRF